MTTDQRPAAAPSGGRGRRAPSPAERQRDPERTRRQILDAATVEFAEKGFAGARVSAIADRAGVNKQLISYYFGGKEGLWSAMSGQWWAHEATFGDRDVPLDELALRYLPTTDQIRAGMRLLVWEGLAGDTVPGDPQRRARFAETVADLRRRQEAGELAPDLDPAFVAVLLFAVPIIPAVLPQIVRDTYQLDPGSEEFATRFAEQFRRLVHHLRPR